MKFSFYDDFELGLVTDQSVLSVAEAVDVGSGPPQQQLEQLIERFDEFQPALKGLATETRRGRPLNEVRLRPPVPNPSQVLCALRNYVGDDRPHSEVPEFFLKSPRSIIGDGDVIELPPDAATVFHHEPELAAVIGRGGTAIAEQDALAHIFGFTGFIDVSARDIGQSYYLRKSFRTFGPMGPLLVTADEIGDPQDLDMRLWVNGKLRQEFSTRQMDHPVARLVSVASRVSGLGVGDVISSGTFHIGMGPLQHGDTVTIETSHIGRLAVHVTDPLRRTWET